MIGKMNFVNGWKSPSKQWDKLNIDIRIGKITIFNLYIDISNKSFRLEIFNFAMDK